MANTTGVAIYARGTLNKQRDPVKDQVRLAREWVDRAGHADAHVEVFTDYAASSGLTDRPGMRALLQAIDGGAVTLVVAESLDRISRDVGDAAHFLRVLARRNCELACLDGARGD